MDKFPQAFVDRIHRIVPEAEWADFFREATAPLPKVVRLASSKQRLVSSDWTLRPAVIPEAFFIDRANQAERPLGKTLEHFTGQIYRPSFLARCGRRERSLRCQSCSDA